MARAAEILAPALAELFAPLQIDLQADAGSLPEIEAGRAGAAQLVLVSIEPTPLQSQYLTTWELWVCVPSIDPADAESELVEILPAVLDALDSVLWLSWTKATRDVHPNNLAAWRIDLTTLT